MRDSHEVHDSIRPTALARFGALFAVLALSGCSTITEFLGSDAEDAPAPAKLESIESAIEIDSLWSRQATSGEADCVSSSAPPWPEAGCSRPGTRATSRHMTVHRRTALGSRHRNSNFRGARRRSRSRRGRKQWRRRGCTLRRGRHGGMAREGVERGAVGAGGRRNESSSYAPSTASSSVSTSGAGSEAGSTTARCRP